MKICTRCRRELDKSFFALNANTKDGLQFHCRDCKAEYAIRYRQHRQQYRRSHLKEFRRYNAKWYILNLEARREKSREWKRNNPDKVKASDLRRRASKLAAFVEDVNKLTVWIRDRGICQLQNSDRCWYWLPSNPSKWHLDHSLALANGGLHSYANAHASCPPCNLEKWAH